MRSRSSLAAGLLLALTLCLPALPVAADAGADSAQPQQTIRLGVLAFRDAAQTRERWQPTADYLSEGLPGTRIQVVPMGYPELERAVADQTIDFVLTNTGHYVQLEAELGITRLATLMAMEEDTPVQLFGGVLFTRADHEGVRSLEDLRGHHLHAVQRGSLGGWQAAYGTLLEAGIEPHADLASLSFTGMPHDRVVEAVMAGETDAGIVRTGLLEGMIREGRLAPEQVRVLAPRETAGFPLWHSTALYPEWPFSRLDHTPEELADAVTIRLLEMPRDHPAAVAGGHHGWSAPLSYAPVHELLERLGAPPYDRTPLLDPWHYWRENPETAFAVLLLVLGVMGAAVLKYRRINGHLALEVEQRRAAEARLRAHEAELAHQARHDPLTGLPNRTLLTERLQRAISAAEDEQRAVAVMFLDLDRFKTVNDSLGHRVGDDLLAILGERLRERVRANTVARLGGDEFIILIDDVHTRPEIEGRARDILGLIAEPFGVGGWQALQVGGSIGISLYPEDATDADTLITQADAAMYQAKASGRNTFSFYTRALTRAASHQLETETRLRRALYKEHLEVFYQPQVDIRSGRITGVEALVRWRDPERGLIPPDAFIPVAEATGLIGEVGRFVLEAACRQLTQWDARGLPPLKLSVNLSAHQIAAADIAPQVRRALLATGLAPDRLILEVTETTLMLQADSTRNTLSELKALGPSLAIDDFGKGYSSLAYLREFAIDILKIDRAFIEGLPDNRSDNELAITIINLGQNLGLSVLAEGVETEQQRAFLERHGCDAWQGYLCSAPLPADQIPALLERHDVRDAGTSRIRRNAE